MLAAAPRPWIAVLCLCACYSPNEVMVLETSGADPTTGDASSSSAGTPTTGDADASSGSPSTSTVGSTSSGGPGDSSGPTTDTADSTGPGSACDPLADECGEGLLCDGTECVAVPDGMVGVPGGAFMMGCNDDVDPDCVDDEYPYHEVTISSFAIDRTEVTRGAYAECVDAGECPAPDAIAAYGEACPDASPNHPVICVDWYRAAEYCAWRGGRLPTEAEWEKAARGTDGRRFPWGNEDPTCAQAHLNAVACGGLADGPLMVGSKPAGASPYGALDMVGNVYEWTADWYLAGYYVRSPSEDPVGPEGGNYRVVRGASWNYSLSFGSRVAWRGSDEAADPDNAYTQIGFRCARSADAPPL